MDKDLISRQAAIDALNKMKIYRPLDSDRYVISDCLNKIVNLPSAQPTQNNTPNALKSLDCIDRKAAIDAINHICPVDTEYDCTLLDRVDVRYVLSDLPSVQPEHTETHSCENQRTEMHESRREWYMKGYRDAQRWIPFETREPDAEEKQEHPEWDFILCGKLPQDGQRILVNIKYKGHEAVQMDEYNDDGGECYLDSGYDIATEATAWMPLPEPYKEVQNETD